MTFLIDTNIISEVRKGDQCDPAVAAWWNGVGEEDLWLSSLVLGKIRKGVELARRRDIGLRQSRPARGYGHCRAMGQDERDPHRAGRRDGLLAATAKVNGLTLVTRNLADVAGLNVDALNPFEV